MRQEPVEPGDSLLTTRFVKLHSDLDEYVVIIVVNTRIPGEIYEPGHISSKTGWHSAHVSVCVSNAAERSLEQIRTYPFGRLPDGLYEQLQGCASRPRSWESAKWVT